jgi:hypothetical protein
MALAADTKPTNAATNAEIWVTDTDDIYRYNGTSWVLLVANDKTETLTNKTISGTANTLTNISASAITGNYTGLSTDTKPTTAVPANSQFTETDTRRVFHWTGAAWILLKASGFSSKKNVLYKIGSTYYYERYDGTVISSSGTLETVLQAAIDTGGTTSVPAGSYVFNSAGVNLETNVCLELDPNAQFSVPQGFTGTMFNVPQQKNNIHVSGGYLFEAGTPAKLWTGIKLDSTNSAGIFHCSFRNMKIRHTGKGIHLNTTGSDAFLNACLFEEIWIDKPIIGVNFESNYDGLAGTASGINRNLFQQVWVQDDTTLHDCTYGFKDIQNFDNTFIACKVWDQSSSVTQKTATIAPKSIHTTIIGGIMARDSDFFVDNSWPRSTVVINGDYHTSPLVVGGMSVDTGSMVSNGKKAGGFSANATTAGWGIFGGGFSAYTGIGTTTQTITYANGTGGRTIPTLTVTGNGAGYRFTNLFTCRGWNPRFRAKVLFNTNTLQRIYFGLAGTASADLAGDDPLNAMAGVLIGARSADTNFQVMHNDAAGATNFIDTGVPINTTSIRTFDIKASETSTTNKWKWSIDGSAWADITSADTPTQTTALGLHFAIITNESGVAKSMTVFEVRAETR